MIKKLTVLLGIFLLSSPLAIEATQLPTFQPTQLIQKTLISKGAKTQTVRGYTTRSGTRVNSYKRSPKS